MKHHAGRGVFMYRMYGISWIHGYMGAKERVYVWYTAGAGYTGAGICKTSGSIGFYNVIYSCLIDTMTYSRSSAIHFSLV